MYIEVNGVNLYYKKTECVNYENKGVSETIILLHGNGEDHSIFNKLTEKLANNYTVYGIDSRNHGKSESVGKTINYNDIAEDIIEFISVMSIKKPIIYGFSDGGIVALLIGVKTSNIISKLIVAGANIRPNGIKSIWRVIFTIQAYLTVNIEKRQNLMMMLKEPNISHELLNSISVVTLILSGEKDLIKKNHTKEIANNIENSSIKILNGENHYNYIVNSDKSYEIIIDFLNNNHNIN